MKHIIVLNGYPRSGKDTFVNLLSEISYLPVFHVSWVDKIKLMAMENGWDGIKDLAGRKILADLADDNDNECFNFILDCEENIHVNNFILCIHTRRPKNISELVKYFSYPSEVYKVTSVCIIREFVESNEQSNTADSEILDYNYDYYIDNSNVSEDWREEFKQNIEIFYNDFMRK